MTRREIRGGVSFEISQLLLAAARGLGRANDVRAMNERDIFLGALEREDPAARAAYLDAVCAGRPALRQRVERLLQQHQRDDTFLNVPALEQLAAAEASLAFL